MVLRVKTFGGENPRRPQQLRSANVNLNEITHITKTKQTKKCQMPLASSTGTNQRTAPSQKSPRIETVQRLTGAPPPSVPRPPTAALPVLLFRLCDLFLNSLQGYQESRLVPRSRCHAVKRVVGFFGLFFPGVVFRSFSPRVDLISVSNLRILSSGRTLYKPLLIQKALMSSSLALLSISCPLSP